MAFYDSHCHLDFDALREDRDAVWARARRAGVTHVLVPGVDEAQWRRAERLRDDAQHPNAPTIAFAVGVHPCHEGGIEQLESWVDRLSAVAVGEVGWDRRAPRRDDLVDAHIELARARGLPTILHIVGAHGHAHDRLRRHAPLRGVVHAFSGSAEMMRRYVELGLSISIGPSVLRPQAKRIHAAARAVPDHALLIETDAPDQIGQPADVAQVAGAVARLRETDVADIARLTRDNALQLFATRDAE